MTTKRPNQFRIEHHITEDDLEPYALDRIKDEGRLAPIEEHLLVCHECQDRLRTVDDFSGSMRAALRLIIWRAKSTRPTTVSSNSTFIEDSAASTLVASPGRVSTRVTSSARQPGLKSEA